ncbi:hypothetical protein [Nitrincola sp.]|uniref:hypothetical protein n=1 Tax=Nitrincola sp. TaxID=1926584 RepID=UPI003A917C37
MRSSNAQTPNKHSVTLAAALLLAASSVFAESPILLVAPPEIQKAKGNIAPKFEGAEEKAVGLSAAIAAVAEECRCHFFDAGLVTSTSRVDGVHLDEDQHDELGLALAKAIQPLVS